MRRVQQTFWKPLGKCICELSVSGLFGWFCGFFPLSLLSVLINFKLSTKASVCPCVHALCFLTGGEKHLCDCYNKDRIKSLIWRFECSLSIAVWTHKSCRQANHKALGSF